MEFIHDKNLRVAKILGWQGFTKRFILGTYTSMATPPNKNIVYPIPNFMEDPTADYKVLEYIRNNFQTGIMRNIHVLNAFTSHYLIRWKKRAAVFGPAKQEYLLMYQPGDYSNALLSLGDLDWLFKEVEYIHNE